MRSRLSRWLAFGFGSGLSRVAPGTVGTLAAWAIWAVLAPSLPYAWQTVVVLGGFAVGVWACGRAADDLRVADHPSIVWDEIIAFWFVLMNVPADYGSQFSAFLLFRFFDIVKPPPIRQIDQGVRGGLGVMLDDVAAALYTILIFAILLRL